MTAPSIPPKQTPVKQTPAEAANYISHSQYTWWPLAASWLIMTAEIPSVGRGSRAQGQILPSTSRPGAWSFHWRSYWPLR
jgi:hypothetical protein